MHAAAPYARHPGVMVRLPGDDVLRPLTLAEEDQRTCGGHRQGEQEDEERGDCLRRWFRVLDDKGDSNPYGDGEAANSGDEVSDHDDDLSWW